MCKPNDPIVLENTSIISVQNQCLSTPCSVRAVLYLSPRIRFSINSDHLPIEMLQRFMYKPFCVSLICGAIVKVRIGSLDPNCISASHFKGSLVPVHSPCMVANSDVRLQSARFSVLNFKKFQGDQDKHIYEDGMCRRLGFTKLEADSWRIELTENWSLIEDKKILKQESGYSITHHGTISCFNSEGFSVKEVMTLLDGLRNFLSFARGAACGLTHVKGTDVNGVERFLLWGCTYVEPWNENRHSWLPVYDGGESLSEAFTGFWKLFIEKEWNDTVRRAIDWYVNSADSAVHMGIVLTQAALESLSYSIKQEKEYSFGKSLKKTLEELEIEDKIPSLCKHLEAIAKQKGWTDGPTAITKIRNDIVHPERRHGHISMDALLDSLRLNQWYIELILLRKFEYHGRYKNRLIIGNQNPFELVPWLCANGEST